MTASKWTSIAFIAVQLIGALNPVGQAADKWSHGSTDEAWERINRLQSVGQKTTVRSEFVSACTKSSNTIERAAAVCWIRRTNSTAHVIDLQQCLDDQSPEVQRLAWNALLQLPDTQAASVILQEIETRDELPSVHYTGSGIGEIDEFPDAVCRLLLKERKEWIAKLENRQRWIESFVEQRRSSSTMQVSLERSIIDSDQPLGLSISSKVDAAALVFLRHIHEETACKKTLYNDLTPLERSSTNGEWVQFKPAKPFEPGVYAVSLNSTQATACNHFPFFIRVNRSMDQESEVHQLLDKPLDEKIVERFGRLRSQAAVPRLIDHFLATEDCEQAATARALACIGDERATKAFLMVPRLTCFDTSFSSRGFLFELNQSSKAICSEAFVEIGTELLKNWNSKPGNKQRLASLRSCQLALLHCNRPLGDKQAKIGAEISSQLFEELKQPPGPSHTFSRLQTYEFEIAYIGNESHRMIEWLQANKDNPELILDFLSEFNRRSKVLEESRQFMLELSNELAQWNLLTLLNPDQTKKLERELRVLKEAIRTYRKIE